MRKTEFDSKIIVYRSRQVFLLVMVAAMTGFFTLMILKNAKEQMPWYALVAPITIAGLSFLLVPNASHWEYKPWQGKARRVEQQQR